jgi:hypothetical protein
VQRMSKSVVLTLIGSLALGGCERDGCQPLPEDRHLPPGQQRWTCAGRGRGGGVHPAFGGGWFGHGGSSGVGAAGGAHGSVIRGGFGGSAHAGGS